MATGFSFGYTVNSPYLYIANVYVEVWPKGSAISGSSNNIYLLSTLSGVSGGVTTDTYGITQGNSKYFTAIPSNSSTSFSGNSSKYVATNANAGSIDIPSGITVGALAFIFNVYSYSGLNDFSNFGTSTILATAAPTPVMTTAMQFNTPGSTASTSTSSNGEFYSTAQSSSYWDTGSFYVPTNSAGFTINTTGSGIFSATINSSVLSPNPTTTAPTNINGAMLTTNAPGATNETYASNVAFILPISSSLGWYNGSAVTGSLVTITLNVS